MKSVIFGAGTYGEVYLAYFREAGINVVGFIDDEVSKHGTLIGGVTVLGGRDSLAKLKEKGEIDSLYCPVGNNKVRVDILSYALSLGIEVPNFIHKSAIVDGTVNFGKGVYILPGTIIMPYANLSDYAMISMGVKIAHHSLISEGSFLSTGVNFGANIVLGKFSFVGIGATVMTGVKLIGESSIVGAGSVVIRDVPPMTVVAGNPAKVIRSIK